MAQIAALLPLIFAAVVIADSSTPTKNWNNVTGTSSTTFPTDVGFLGKLMYGQSPFVAQVDKLDTNRPNGKYGIEMRWLPKDGKKDDATPDDIFRNLGQVSPYHIADDLFPETNKYRSVPDNCEIKQVHLLSRHGARYPTGSKEGGQYKFGQKVAKARQSGDFKAEGDLSFLNSWNYSLGSEVLVHTGAQELFDSGVKAYLDYAKLLDGYEHKPVIRTTSQSRMLDSARYWTLGFFGWDAPEKMHLEVLTEDSSQNNTLAPVCNEVYYDDSVNDWIDTYSPPIAKRLNSMLTGFKISDEDIYNVMTLCGYETVSQGYSDFCNIFTKEEWEQHEYTIDLQFQTGSMFLNPIAKAKGVGWVTEFLDRVTNSKFDGPQSLQNSTLDSNPTYFPLKQPLYADFSHDTVISNILTAFNFTQFADDLDFTKINKNRRYRTSRVTPFGALIAFEILECDNDQYLRVKVNEAVVPMNQDQGCEKRDDGLCKLDSFVKHQKEHAFKDSHFETACMGKNGTDYIVTGPVKTGTLSKSQIKAVKSKRSNAIPGLKTMRRGA
ncbi:hypothetical protein MVES1_001878 [Malassezia vespertilionis]|uniref:Acid phosphatase n=1 Tax=Malassezia vespertilionis TaxID=2020962 RepID=A0A2N1JDL1_9BASI|nr:uncharacterized protein MVES1_001878 [Malassezia vespertilionis]PKI84633.1 hypothetical protein MVES_001780 [Malassezia vespertilionis]WFD06529.1 hypothetical protein MVES1_001878 [Malassezia vespertilionis]